MKKLFLNLGLGFGLAIATSLSAAFAVQPSTVAEDAKINWSQVIDDPFDGKVVYDKHYTDAFSFVSSWSLQEIRATYTEKKSVLVGYRTNWQTRWVRDDDCKHEKRSDCRDGQRRERYSTREPIYRTDRTDRTPQKILFAIAGNRYTYENGAVSPELAAALAQAPEENMRIRLVWEDGKTTDTIIGKGTVKAWKTIFKAQI